MGFTNIAAVQAALRANQTHKFIFQKASVAPTAGRFNSLWPAAGFPAAGAYPGIALEAAQQDSATLGALPFPDAPAGMTRHIHAAGFGFPSSGAAGLLYLLDRLLVYPAIDVTSNSLQTFTNPVALPRYADGEGVVAFLEVTTPLTAGTSTSATLVYVNQDGDPSSVTFASPTSGVAPNGEIMPALKAYIPFGGADRGIRSATSFQFAGSTHAFGTASLILAKPLGVFPIPAASSYAERDLLVQVPALPRIYDDACLMAVIMSGSVITTTAFGLIETVCG